MALIGRRQRAYGEDHELTPLDRSGVRLSSRQVRHSVRDFAGKRVAFGCDYRATIARTLLAAWSGCCSSTSL